MTALHQMSEGFGVVGMGLCVWILITSSKFSSNKALSLRRHLALATGGVLRQSGKPSRNQDSPNLGIVQGKTATRNTRTHF